MENREFFRKLIIALANQRFEIDEELYDHSMRMGYSKECVSEHGSFVKAMLKYSQSCLADYQINEEEFQRDIRSMTEIGGRLLVMYKFEGEYTTIVGAINGDDISDSRAKDIASQFDRYMTSRISKYAAKSYINGYKTKLGVYGCLIYIFSSSQKAQHFADNIRKKCSHSHFFKLVHNRAWIVDIEGRRVISHTGLPKFGKVVIDAQTLENHLF